MATRNTRKRKRRNINQDQYEDEPPKKKQKVCDLNNTNTDQDDQQSDIEQIDDEDMSNDKEIQIEQINPSRFQHDSDEKQFEELTEIIDESISKLGAYDINIIQLISEYSTGEWKTCGNIKCKHKISVLYGDINLYDDNQSNAKKLGYKYCRYSNNYFCFICMNSTESRKGCTNSDCKCCMQLIFKSDDTICSISTCSRFVVEKCIAIDPRICECHYIDYNKCISGICNKCNLCESKFCYQCWYEHWSECIECSNDFCKECMHKLPKSNGYVCNNCYDGTMIQCRKCHRKSRKWYKSNQSLIRYKGDNLEGMICGKEQCQTVACFECDQSQYIRISGHGLCWRHNPF